MRNNNTNDNATRREKFFVLRVVKKLNKNETEFILSKAKDEIESMRQFECMRPKAPFLNLEEWQVDNVFDLSNKDKFDELQENFYYCKIVFYINKTVINTLPPYNYGRYVNDLDFREKATKITFIEKPAEESREQDINRLLNKLEMYLGTTNLKCEHISAISEYDSVQYANSFNENVAFVFFNATLDDVISFMKDVYVKLKHRPAHLQFFYSTKDQLYSISLNDTMVIRSI